MFREDYAIVLDFLGAGYAESFKKEPIIQALGETYFSMLEIVARPDTSLHPRDRIYIGPEKREHVQFIKGRLVYDRLTSTAKNELPAVVNELVNKSEQKYVDFFNKAGAITVRKHSLELLPNIGKKHMMALLDERNKKPFVNFDDIRTRVKLMPDPVRVISARILEELEGENKFNIFIRPLPRGEENQP